MRVALAVVVSLALLSATLWGVSVRGLGSAQREGEEFKLYEVTSQGLLELKVMAQTRRVVLDVVRLLPIPTSYRPEARFPFEIEVALVAQTGERKVHRLWEQPRVSLSKYPPSLGAQRGTHVYGEPLWGTDAIQRVLDTGTLFANQGGRVQLRAVGDVRLLVRAFAERATRSAFKEVRVRRLGRRERRQLGGLGAGLGFADVPEPALRRRVSAQRVRLDSEGIEGRDYRLVRVRMTDYRGGYVSEPVPPTLHVSPEAWAAFNVEGSGALEIRGPPGLSLRYSMGHPFEPNRAFDLDERGEGRIAYDTQGPETLVLESGRPAELSFFVLEPDRPALLGEPREVVQPPLRWLLPDVRATRWSRLSPHDPVCFELLAASGQRRFRLAVRRVGPLSAEQAGLSVHFLPGGRTHRLDSRAEASKLDRFVTASGLSLSAGEPERRTFALEPSDEMACVRGSEALSVRGYADNPWSERDVFEAPYGELRERGWVPVSAPLAQRRFFAVAPSPSSTASGAGALVLKSQVRLVPEAARARPGGRGRARRAEPDPVAQGRARVRRLAARAGSRTLTPEGEPRARRVLISTPHRRYRPDQRLYTEFTRGRRLRVGARGKLNFVLRAKLARLPAPVTLQLDDGAVHRLEQRQSVQRFSVPAAPGEHQVTLSAPSGTRAFARNLPADFGHVWRELNTFPLASHGRLGYRVRVRRGQALGLVLSLYSEQRGAAYRVQVRVTGQAPQTFVGVTRAPPSVLSWDGDFDLAGGAAVVRPYLLVSGEPRELQIELLSKGDANLSARLVLLGQRAPRETRLSVSRRRRP